jgi:hypothetical protein
MPPAFRAAVILKTEHHKFTLPQTRGQGSFYFILKMDTFPWACGDAASRLKFGSCEDDEPSQILKRAAARFL